MEKYPYSKNRLLIIDWSSLAYHQIFAMKSKANVALNLDMPEGPEEELYIWRTNMVSKMIKYIKAFNPRDIIVTLEGNNVWRNKVVKEYYNDHCTVYYDDTNMYLRYDNFLFKVTKTKDSIDFEKMDVVKDIASLPEKSKKLGEMPKRLQDVFWDMRLPAYKGQRRKSNWPFEVDKKVWKKYKEAFPAELTNLFRLHVIGHDDAEGDDIIYVAMNYWKEKYDSIILITGDSDMNQLLTEPKLKIFKHIQEEFVDCPSPKDMLELKILSGDKSDNINGMALPGKKLQLGIKGAQTLYESVSNCYEEAKKGEWDDQYMRNKTLIDLKSIPTNIQREICTMLDKSKPDIVNEKKLTEIGITKKMIDEAIKLKNLGFYAVNKLANVEHAENRFNPKLFTDDSEYNQSPTAPERKFEGVEEVFPDPF